MCWTCTKETWYHLKKEKKGMGGKGRLTNNMIDKLQNYYGIAIRSNCGNLSSMKTAIHASLFHCASSADRKLHLQHCPGGANSWCGYMRDRANQTNNYNLGAGLPLDVIAELKPIYSRLSEDSLLSRCLDGRTQNQNEALNGMFWEKVPKGVFVGTEILQLGIYDAVTHFNIGCHTSVMILEELGISSGLYCLNESQRADSVRVSKANYKEQEVNKSWRRLLRGKRKKKTDKQQEKEGDTYVPGGF